MKYLNIFSGFALSFFFISVQAESPTTEPSATSKVISLDKDGKTKSFYYEMPQTDHHRSHPDWDDNKGLTYLITDALSERVGGDPNDWFEDNFPSFKVAVGDKNHALFLNLNCSRNAGGGLLISENWNTFVKEGVGSIQGFWYDFNSQAACRDFRDYMIANAAKVSEKDPVGITVDDNHFYAVVRIEHYLTK